MVARSSAKVWQESFAKNVNHFIASLEREFAGITLCAIHEKEKAKKKKMINGFFLHMKEDDACKREVGGSIKYQCQSMIHARYHQGNLISSLVEQSLH